MQGFKKKLKNNELLVGTLITLSSPEITEIMSDVGFDWLWIDMEHAPLDYSQVQNMIQAASNTTCIVRSPWNDEVYIKKILDLGCDGIILPQIKTANEAKLAIKSCKYPPLGIRSIGIARAQKYGMDFKNYLEKANDDLIIMLQIEHIEGINNIESITDIKGIDAIIIGPFDLSGSMGLLGQINHPEVENAIKKVKLSCKKKDIPFGIFTPDSNSAEIHLKQGCKLIAMGIDSNYLWKSANQALTELDVFTGMKQALEDKAAPLRKFRNNKSKSK